jgi:fructose-1,6-bisphosphatase/inositol monophosphatase family enzyme
MTIPDTDAVSTIIRDVSERIVMPGFRNLDDVEVFEKSAGELVTESDIAAELFLSEHLRALVPGSLLLGEESYEDNPALMDLMDADGPVWIVDPIDGTGNFAKGRDCFAVMVAYRDGGVTQGGWIYDPVTGRMVSAQKGEGARCNGAPLSAPGQGGQHLRGSIGTRLSKRLDALREQDTKNLPERIQRYRCCGREYMDLALGQLQFVQYGMSLKPWDHAPGVLIAEEAGYHVAFLEDGTPHDAAGGIKTGHLMTAPDEAAWEHLRDLLWV